MKNTLRQDIIEFLLSLNMLETQDGRRAVLNQAGINELKHQIDFSGSTLTFVNNLFETLAESGQIA